MADKIQNEVVKIHRSQVVLKILCLPIADRSQLRRHTVEMNPVCWNAGLGCKACLEFCCFIEFKLQQCVAFLALEFETQSLFLDVSVIF
jgi:hypothetical protein